MKKYLKMLGLIILYYGLSMGVSYVGVVLLFKLPFIPALAQNTPTVFYGFVDPFLITILFLVLKFAMKRSPIRHCKFTPITPVNLVMSAALGILMGVFSYSLVSLDYMVKNLPQIVGPVKYFILSGNIFLLTYVVIVNSISKEIQFRGLMFNELKGNMPVAVAVILQACLYASQLLITGNDVRLAAYAFLGQFVFGLIYLLGRSIWSSIAAQICCTMTMVAMDRTLVKTLLNNQSGLFLVIASIAAIILIIVLLDKTEKNSENSKNTAYAKAGQEA